MKRFLYYLLLPLYQFNKKTDELYKDDKKIAVSLSILVFVGVLYTLTCLLLYLKGVVPILTPWLAIELEKYYLYLTFFTIPLFVLLAITFAGVFRVIAEILGGKGSFENTFALYGIVIVLPLILTMWIPETVVTIFIKDVGNKTQEGNLIIPLWIDIPRQVIGVIWPFILSIIGLKKSEKLSWLKTIISGSIAFIVYTVLVLIFIR